MAGTILWQWGSWAQCCSLAYYYKLLPSKIRWLHWGCLLGMVLDPWEYPILAKDLAKGMVDKLGQIMQGMWLMVKQQKWWRCCLYSTQVPCITLAAKCWFRDEFSCFQDLGPCSLCPFCTLVHWFFRWVIPFSFSWCQWTTVTLSVSKNLVVEVWT